MSQDTTVDPSGGGSETLDTETQEILNELNGEAPPAETPDAKGPEGEKPTDQGKPDEGKTGEEGKKPDGEADAKPADKGEERRPIKLMPAWKHEAAKADWEKDRAALLADLEKFRAGSTPDGGEKGTGNGSDAPQGAALEKVARDLAEKHGITEELAKDLIQAQNELGGKLPPELVEKLKVVDELQATRDVEVETAKFNADFDSLVLPLVKAEYGDDIPPEMVAKIRDELKELAYDPEGTYAKVPYTMLYKGNDIFRDVIAPVKKGAEGPRDTSAASKAGTGEGRPDLTKPLSEEVVKNLSGEDFDTYSKNMETYEREQKSS